MTMALPNELWGQVCEYLSHKSLSKLCLSSSLFLTIARPVLYRSVFITVDDATLSGSTASRTLTLLAENLQLASSTHKLDIRASASALVPGLTADFFRNLVNLRHLRLAGPILVSNNEEAKKICQVVETLNIKHLHLKDLTQDIVRPATNYGMSLASERLNPAFCAATGQPPNLFMVPVPGSLKQTKSAPLFSDLFSMNLSHLTLLHILNIDSDRLSELVNFLNRTTSLEQLLVTLKSRSITQPPIDFGPVLAQFTPNTLADLTSLGLPVAFLQATTQVRMRSLATLDTLILHREQPNGPRSFFSVLDDLQEFYTQHDYEAQTTVVRTLKDLTVDFWVVNPSYSAMIINRCSEIWRTSLRTLRLPFSTFNMAAEWTSAWSELVTVISTFSSLKNIYFRRWVPSQSPTQDEATCLYIKKIVDQLVSERPTLESIVFMENDEVVIETYRAQSGWERQLPVNDDD